MEKLDLGFAEKCESWKLRSHFFPSKVGGKPAWLDLKSLPSMEDLQCKICNRQMIFLCQIYAPYEEDPSSFHRTVFIFVCRNAACCTPNCSDNLKVFRSNLPVSNEFYPDQPVEEKEDVNVSLTKWVRLCQVCGCKAVKWCAKCEKTFYCCREHQVADWKSHKKICGNDDQTSESKLLFSEFELVIEQAEVEENEEEELNQESALQMYEQLKSSNELGTLQDIPESELQSFVGSSSADTVFQNFVDRLKLEPQQVLRYNRGKTPLFISKKPLPDVIPNCEYCSSPRQFEFQILPYLLVLLSEQELDWGTLIVYTCKNSCSLKPGYKQEYMFKQDVSQND